METKEDDEYLRKRKPEGEDYHFTECIGCHKQPDGSFFFSEFGLCLRCWGKWKRKIPHRLYTPLGRIFLFDVSKRK